MSEQLSAERLAGIRERAEKVRKLALHDKAHIVVKQTEDTMVLLEEVERLQKDIPQWRALANQALNKQMQLIEESIKYALHVRRARKQRDALTQEVDRLRDALKGAEAIVSQAKGYMEENSLLRAELEAAKRDLHDLSDVYKFCNMCKYHNGEGVDTCSHPLRFSCDAENFYEWRGVPANTPAQGATDETDETRGGGDE